MATAGPSTKTDPVVADDNSTEEKKKNRGTVGLVFGVATAAIVLGLTLATGGAALSAAFLIKSLFVSAFTGLLFGALAEGIANGEFKTGRRAVFVRRHHIGVPPPVAVPHHRVHVATHIPVHTVHAGPKKVHVVHTPVPTATVHKTTTLHTGPAKTFTPSHTAARTAGMHTTTRVSTPSNTPHAAHRPAMHRSNHR